MICAQREFASDRPRQQEEKAEEVSEKDDFTLRQLTTGNTYAGSHRGNTRGRKKSIQYPVISVLLHVISRDDAKLLPDW